MNNKFFRGLLALFLIILLILLISCRSILPLNKNPLKSIKDPALRNAIELTEAELSNIVHLEVIQPVTDFSGLKRLPNLKSLTLHQVNGYDNIKQINHIEALTIYGNDLSFLQGLGNLEVLSVTAHGGTFSGTKGLAKLTRLKELTLTGATLDDISFLKSLKSLQKLDLSHTGIKSLDLVARLPLTELNLSGNPISDLDGPIGADVLIIEDNGWILESLRQLPGDFQVTYGTGTKLIVVDRAVFQMLHEAGTKVTAQVPQPRPVGSKRHWWVMLVVLLMVAPMRKVWAM